MALVRVENPPGGGRTRNVSIAELWKRDTFFFSVTLRTPFPRGRLEATGSSASSRTSIPRSRASGAPGKTSRSWRSVLRSPRVSWRGFFGPPSGAGCCEPRARRACPSGSGLPTTSSFIASTAIRRRTTSIWRRPGRSASLFLPARPGCSSQTWSRTPFCRDSSRSSKRFSSRAIRSLFPQRLRSPSWRGSPAGRWVSPHPSFQRPAGVKSSE